MKLNGHSNIEYNLPSSKPSNAKTLIYGTVYDNNNKFWELEEGDTPSVLVNGVEIDWNGAELDAAVQSLESNVQEGVAVSNINTTGDLIKVVAQLQAQVNVLTTLVKGLYNALQA